MNQNLTHHGSVNELQSSSWFDMELSVYIDDGGILPYMWLKPDLHPGELCHFDVAVRYAAKPGFIKQ